MLLILLEFFEFNQKNYSNLFLSSAFYSKAEVEQDEKKPNHLVIAMTSDRGLCGSVHSNIVRTIKADLPNKPEGTNVKFIAIGDKSRAILGRLELFKNFISGLYKKRVLLQKFKKNYYQ